MKNEDYTVELVLKTLAPLTEETLFAVAELGGAAGGNVGGRRLEVTMTVTAAHPHLAIDKALRKVVDLVHFVIASTAAMTIEEFDRREAERSALVGVAEVAEMLGVSRQRVTALSKRDDFPAPLQRLASGPVWRGGDLSTFKEGWQRKGGRPSKGVDMTHSLAGSDAPVRTRSGPHGRAS